MASQNVEQNPVALLGNDAQQRQIWAGEWLHSEDPSKVAWGAWLVRLDRQTALIPLLLDKVNRYRVVEDWDLAASRDRHDAMLQVLDALIELKAAVPPEDALKLYREFSTQSVILLVRSTEDARAELLTILDQARTNWTWLAAGNALLKTVPHGFCARLLAKFTTHLTVRVEDPGRGSGSGGGGSECGFSAGAGKSNWPHVGLYRLTQFPERIPWLAATFLVAGPTPVFYLRSESGNYDNPSDLRGACDDGNRDVYRAQYLAKLLNTNLEAYPEERIEWHDAAGYIRSLRAAINRQIQAFQTAAASLQALNHLTSEEASSFDPLLEVVIMDNRQDRSIPLPTLTALPERVKIGPDFREPVL